MDTKRRAFWVSAILNSYGQIFFSLNPIFSGIILLVTFFVPVQGVVGLAAVVLVNVLAFRLGFSRAEVGEGVFGFNALLLGLALAHQFDVNFIFCLFFIIAIFVLLMMTAVIKGFLQTYRLPFVSLPFLATYWLVSLSAGNMESLIWSSQGVYVANEALKQQESIVFQIVHSLDSFSLPLFVSVFLRTLSATFFIDSIFGGLLLAVGLLYNSRIAFSLAVIGFSTAVVCYQLLGVPLTDLTYGLSGSNFIFWGIAIGGFYLIPNVWSYLAVVVLTPVLMMLVISFSKILTIFQLKSFTLAFSLLTILFLFALLHRWLHQFLQLAAVQYYHAEKTIYKHLSSLRRLKNISYAKISLPFWGEWIVSQGYNGSITHLGDWSFALDFVIQDDEQKTYYRTGVNREDYYCYNKPVLAPLDGYVYDIHNHVEENSIIGVNTEQNWGNSIIINHLNGLYSQISHIKKDSFVVSIGDYVTRGAMLAACGNSGRSPEPHIHFQLQTIPWVGAKTLPYPIAYFIEKDKTGQEILRTFEVPKENTVVSNVQTAELFVNSYDFKPGRKIVFLKEGTQELIAWEVLTDAWNQTYLFCNESKSVAYFVNDGTMFYFSDFEGDRNSLLFQFYIASFRVLLGCYPKIALSDQVPLIHFSNVWVQWIQDFLAPFHLFIKAVYENQITAVDNQHAPTNLVLASTINTHFWGNKTNSISYKLTIYEKRIQQFTIMKKNQATNYLCVAS